jgi:hypothetical protein
VRGDYTRRRHRFVYYSAESGPCQWGGGKKQRAAGAAAKKAFSAVRGQKIAQNSGEIDAVFWKSARNHLCFMSDAPFLRRNMCEKAVFIPP